MNLPQHRTTDQHFMSVMCELLAEQVALLADIRDRLPEQTSDRQSARSEEGGAVVLREPAVPPRAAEALATEQFTEPDQPAAGTTPEVSKRAGRRPPARKTAAGTRRTTKGTS